MNTEKELKSEIIIYQQDNGNIKIDVHLEGETVWLTQKLIAKLFLLMMTVLKPAIP